jgi:cephalosporin-C deacetylase-like acetyl esterase
MKRSTFLQLLAGARLAAQARGENWNFLEYASVFPDVRGMLGRFLRAQAAELLEARRKRVESIGTVAGLDERRREFRAFVWDVLGGEPERTPLKARVVGSIERPDHRVEKVIFESRPGFPVTANLYLPRPGAGPWPAILFPLGHEDGAKAHHAWQRCLVSLARRGFVCLTWDPVGQGERIQYWDADLKGSKARSSTVEHTMLGQKCLLTGTHMASFTIWDGIRALDYLVSRPEVDRKRIGCTGNSGGGTHTSYLSALDDRIQVSAASCYITSWKRMLETIGPQDAEQVFPWMLERGFDYPDYIYGHGLKPFLMLCGIRDFFPIQGARASFEEARRLFTRLGAADQVEKFEWDDGHGYNPQRRLAAYRWFTRWLKGAEEQREEAPVELASEAELQCTGTGQVATQFPAGADVHTITLERARKLKAGRGKGDLARRVRELARCMPFEGPARVTGYGWADAPGCRVEKLTVAGEPGLEMPALLFLPAGEGRHPAVVLAGAEGKASMAGAAARLARAGAVVLAVDLCGLGETAPKDGGGNWSRAFGNYDAALTAQLVGRTLPGLRAMDVVRAVDVLARRKDVAPASIQAAGEGVAALPVLLAAVLEKRIAGVVLEGMLVSYQRAVEERLSQGLPELVIPGALSEFDLPELVAALAGRRVTISNAVDASGQDLPVAAVRAEYAGAPGVRIVGRDASDRSFASVLPGLLGH